MAIKFLGGRFRYPDSSSSTVLNIPEWTMAKGEQVFLHGPSGCGKSTLLNLVGGLLTLTEGELHVLDQRLDQMTNRQRDRFRANHIGYVFQQFNLIPYLNAIDNVRVASQLSLRKISASQQRQEISALLTSLNLPEQDWYKKTRHLSIGQQQRVAIARALINKPKLLIADEPTSSLDQSNRDDFMKLLKSMAAANEISLLFVSHDMSLSQYFDRTECLNDINRVESFS